MPMPVSRTAQAQHDLAGLGELDRVARQVDEDLLQPHRVADNAARQVRRHVEQHFHVLAADAGGQDHRELAQQPVDAHGLRVELHLACFDLGVVEDVAEQAEQRARGTLGLAGVVELARVELGLLQELQHAEHRVHRRADLVAHVGEKLALRFGRALRLLGGAHEVGHVEAEDGGVAVVQAALDDAQPAAGLALAGAELHGAGAGAVLQHALGNPGFASARMAIGAVRGDAVDLRARDGLEARARLQQGRHLGMRAAVALVADNKAIARVVEHEADVDRLHRAVQQVFGAQPLGLEAAALAEVHRADDEAAARDRHTVEFEHDAVGPAAFQADAVRRSGEGQQLRGHAVGLGALPVFAALAVETDDLGEGQRAAPHQTVQHLFRQVDQLAVLAVGADELMPFIEDGEAARQVVGEGVEQAGTAPAVDKAGRLIR
jgi:hypothetical protein